MKKFSFFIVIIALLSFIDVAYAATSDIPFIISQEAKGVTTYSLSIKILAAVTILTVIPALLITSTAFTRVIIVLAILRQALGIPNVPSNQILIGLSLILTVFIMSPILNDIEANALTPYMDGKIDDQQAFDNASGSLKSFMLKQTRKADLNLFKKLAKDKTKISETPSFFILLPAYITSELKTAFQVGFIIFVPFLIIDLLVASILMSMGMMMLSPMIIALPFKVLFFVLVDGWDLVITSLVTSFR